MKNIARIIRIAKPLYGLIGILAVIILVTAVLQQVAPLTTKYIVDEITAKLNGTGGDLSRLMFYVALAFAVGFISDSLGVLGNRLGDHFGGKLKQYLTEKFYEKVLTLPQTYFDSELSGKIINQLNRGIISIQDFVNTLTNFILPTFLQSILTIALLAYFSWPTALFIFALFPIYLVITAKSATAWGKAEVKKNQIEDGYKGRIQEVITNIKVVKSFTNEKNEFGLANKKLTKINKIYATQSNTYHFYDFLRTLSLNLILLGVNIIVFYNAYLGKIGLGDMVLILTLVNQARRPLFAMSFILSGIQNAESGSKEFFEVLDIQKSEKGAKSLFAGNSETEKKPVIKNPTIEFKNVDFSYDKSENVIKSLNLKIESNEKVALVGHSGAGKSTIVNLILKFYNPTAGDIYLGGKNYHDLDQYSIRNNIALVFQENELFSTTIRENVAYGTDGAGEEKVIAALKQANAYDFVMKLAKGLDAEVGERGVKLSGGQKQRIQIARAILKNAPVLILDEATSNLDSQSESYVQEALKNLMQNRLVIIIAHRFSTIQNVDRVFVLEDGKISDSGTPKELANREGLYSSLLKYQIEGNKKLLSSFEIY